MRVGWSPFIVTSGRGHREGTFYTGRETGTDTGSCGNTKFSHSLRVEVVTQLRKGLGVEVMRNEAEVIIEYSSESGLAEGRKDESIKLLGPSFCCFPFCW